MLIISVMPQITPGYCASSDAGALGLSAANDAKRMGKYALEDGTGALEGPGVRMIERKAMDVAGQCAISIRAHPDMSLSDVQQRGIRRHQCRFLPARQPVRVPVNVSLLLVLYDVSVLLSGGMPDLFLMRRCWGLNSL